MTISPFFLDLRSAYQSELDDLTCDSEGRDVLRQRLADKRQEMAFLVRMMELSPEMVAVVFHQGLTFSEPAVMDHLLTHEADEFPEWSSLVEGIQMTPWAKDLADVVLKEPGGEWFMTVAAGLHYLACKPLAGDAGQQEEDDEDDSDHESEDNGAHDDGADGSDGAGDGDAQTRKEAGDDWMVEQGFDRKD